MIVPIYIDTKDLSAEFSMTKSQVESMVDTAVKSITLEAYNLWGKEAQNSLNSTRNRYLQNLILVEAGFMKGEIVLRYEDDPLVRMLEEGRSAFDLKQGFKNSPKAKRNGNDWYLTIPFRYAASGSIGESEVFSGVLPQSVYEKIKPVETNIPMGSGMRSERMKLNEIPAEFQEPKTRPRTEIPKSKVFEEYKNKASLYEGLMKVKDGTTGQSSYMTFRRVSNKSDDNSWIHTGIEKGNFAEKALDKLDVSAVIDTAVDNYLASL